MTTSKLVYYINPRDQQPVSSLSKLIGARIPHDVSPTVLCIGSDRLTGDCLGPITGSKLKNMLGEKISVLGTLENPVHALNLKTTIDTISQSTSDPYIIAVDACLGTHIGSVTLSEGSVVPGAGVNRALSAVGNLAITGIVGSCHGNTLTNLSTVRLREVITLAEIISSALAESLLKHIALN